MKPVLKVFFQNKYIFKKKFKTGKWFVQMFFFFCKFLAGFKGQHLRRKELANIVLITQKPRKGAL